MEIGTLWQNATLFFGNSTLVFALVTGGCAADAEAPTSKKREEQGSGSLTVSEPMPGTYAGLRASSRFAPEPFQETWALRLLFDGGPEGRKQVLVDIDDLPEDPGDVTISMGESEAGGAVSIMSGNPADSSPRFTIEKGRLSLRRSSSGLSGTLTLEAEERGFDIPREHRRTVVLKGSFERVRIQTPDRK